jgi:hypothetical protein
VTALSLEARAADQASVDDFEVVYVTEGQIRSSTRIGVPTAVRIPSVRANAAIGPDASW